MTHHTPPIKQSAPVLLKVHLQYSKKNINPHVSIASSPPEEMIKLSCSSSTSKTCYASPRTNLFRRKMIMNMRQSRTAFKLTTASSRDKAPQKAVQMIARTAKALTWGKRMVTRACQLRTVSERVFSNQVVNSPIYLRI